MSDAAILRAAAAVVEVREATAPWLAGVREGLLRLAAEKGTPHDHTAFVSGCYRCETSRGEAREMMRTALTEDQP